MLCMYIEVNSKKLLPLYSQAHRWKDSDIINERGKVLVFL
jgi:hypothetical protein